MEIRKQHAIEVVKFGLTGVCSTLFNYGIFYVSFKKLDFHYLAASAVGYCSGLVFSYTVNRLWTFRSDKAAVGYRKKEFALFLLAYLGSLILNLTALKIGVTFFHLDPALANIAALGISAVCNFIGLKLFVFKKKPSLNPPL